MRSSSSQGLDSSSSQLPGVRRLVERWGTRGIGCAEDRTGVLDCGCYTKFDGLVGCVDRCVGVCSAPWHRLDREKCSISRLMYSTMVYRTLQM
jgi:hypothetical protein